MKKTIIMFMALGMLFGQVDYESQIQTIIDANCTNSGCHTNGGGYQNGLDLSSYENIMAGDSDHGPVIIPFDHANSYLWQRVNSGEMPPGNNPDLSGDEIDLIADWIDEGALPEPSTVTAIYDIQYVSDPDADDASPLNGQEVTISGVVTAEFWGSDQYRYMHVQDAEGAWNGIVCFNYGGWDSFAFVDDDGSSVTGPAEGDSVTLTGTVEEYSGLTELNDITEGIVHGPGNSIMPPAQLATGDVGEAYEGCLIAVADVTVDDPDLGYGEWSADDGSGSVRLDDKWDYFYYPEEGQNLAEVAGVLDYGYGNYKLQPRLARDVVEADGDPIRIQRVQQVLYSDLIKAGEDEESDMSYMFGDTVMLEGIVTMPTGLSYAGDGVKFIYADPNGGPWSGILTYSPDSTAFPVLFEGDLVQVTGFIDEYTTGPANMTELFVTDNINILDFEQPLPIIDTVNTGDLRWPTEAEQWGNVMVRVEDGIVTNNDLNFEVFAVDDGTGSVLIDDDSDSLQVFFGEIGPPPVGSLVQSIEGWLYHHYGSNADSTAYKLCPLYAEDIVFGAGPPSIRDLSRDPCTPTSSDSEVAVSCVITDNTSVAEALVHYSINGGTYQSVTMETADDSTFTGVIPVSDGDEIYYYITATDDGGEQAEPKSSMFPNDVDHDQLGFHVTDNLTIAFIQQTPWPSGNTLYEGCDVTLTGIVTADTAQYNSVYSSYAFQDGTGQWNGLVFDTEDMVELTRGDEVSVTGLVTDYDPDWAFQFNGNTRLIDSDVTVLSSGNDIPAPTIASCRDLSQTGEEVESYEGVLVKINNVTISSVNQYDWSVTDATGSETLIDDDMATMAANNFMSDLEGGQELDYVMGIFNFSFGTYKLQIRDLADLGQMVGIDDDVQVNPYEYVLHENFPNPFNPETQIRFSVGGQENVKLIIYDVMGRQVRTLVNGESFRPGFHVVNWDGLDNAGHKVASGMYIYRIKAGDFIADKKMLLVK
jgi:DNA/RNA endonuclease YhcR with UshA esterase domain